MATAPKATVTAPARPAGVSVADQARARNLAAATAAGNQTAVANANKAIASAVARGVSSIGTGSPTNPNPQNLNMPEAPATSTSSPEANAGTPPPPKNTVDGSTTFSIPNFNASKDTFGDVSKAPKTQNKTGIATVTQGVITDPSKIDTSKVDPSTYLRGDAAKQQEKASGGGYITARNDTMAAYLYQKGIKDPQAILTELQKLPGFSSGTQSDQINTAQSLAARIGAFQQPAQGDQLQNNLDSIQKQYMAQADAIIKAGAIEDKYTNFNEVHAEIEKVFQAAGNDALLKGYTGKMPSDQDIKDIALKTIDKVTANGKNFVRENNKWYSVGEDGSKTEVVDPAGKQAIAQAAFDRTKQIMEGDGWAALVPQESFRKEQEMGYNRQLEDAATKNSRDLEDMTTKLAAMRTNISQQQADVLDMAQRNIDAMAKMGALRGQSNTTAFTAGLTQVTADAQQTVDRLEAQYKAAESADTKNRARMLEDYNKNLTRAKEDLDKARKEINGQMGQAYNSFLDQYTGEALLGKLQALNTQMLDAKVETIAKYTDAIAKANKLAGTDAESIDKHEKAVADIQKSNMQYLTQNKGLALKSMTLGDLNSMYQNQEISLAQYRMLHERVKQIGGEDLSQYGEVNDTHTSTYQGAVANGMTPTQAVQHTVRQSQTNPALAGANALSEKNKIEAEKPQQFTKFDDAFKKMDQAETISFNQKDKVALGYKKTESADKIKKDLATKYLKSKLPASPTVDQIYSKISTMENSLGESKKWGTKAVQDAFGTAKAIEYAYDVGFDKDLSDDGDLTKFSLGIVQLFKNYGKTPDEKTTMTYLEKAGVPGSWLGKGLRGKIWDKIQSLE